MIVLPSSPHLAKPNVELNLRKPSALSVNLAFTKSLNYDNEKNSPEELRWNKYLNRACREVSGFTELLQRFERNVSVLGRSQRTFDNYDRHVAAMALHFQCIPTKIRNSIMQQRQPQVPFNIAFIVLPADATKA